MFALPYFGQMQQVSWNAVVSTGGAVSLAALCAGWVGQGGGME